MARVAEPPRPAEPEPRAEAAAPVAVEPRRRRILVASGVGLLAALATLPLWGPRALRPLAFFRVRHIEVRGTRWVSPADVAKTLDVDSMRSIWDDIRPLAARVRKLPQIRSVEIERRLPGTLVVAVEENAPIALVPASGGFRAYDEDGRALPIDPSRTPVDLPIVARADTSLFRLLGEVRATNPSFFARVSEARRSGRDEVQMQLVTIPVRMRLDIDVDRLEQISYVEEDLKRRRVAPTELDLRFKDQVIVRIQ